MLNADELREQIREQIRYIRDRESAGGMPVAIEFAIGCFPDESWTLEKVAGQRRYAATLGGTIRAAVMAEADTPEKALTLAVLYLQLKDRETE